MESRKDYVRTQKLSIFPVDIELLQLSAPRVSYLGDRQPWGSQGLWCPTLKCHTPSLVTNYSLEVSPYKQLTLREKKFDSSFQRVEGMKALWAHCRCALESPGELLTIDDQDTPSPHTESPPTRVSDITGLR